MPKLPSLKPKEAEKALLNAGFQFVRQKGSHRMYSNGKYSTVIPFHTRDLKKGTLRAIIRESGLTLKELFSYL